MAKRKNPPPKGVVPPMLVGKGFDVHPEHINKFGAPKDAVELRKLISEIGAQKIRVAVQKGKSGNTKEMTRFERIIYEWFETQNVHKQELLMAYEFGKPIEKIEVTGLKTIVVTIKKRDDDNSSS